MTYPHAPRKSDLHHGGCLPFIFCILSLIIAIYICLARIVWMFVSPLKFICWNPIPSETIFGSRVLGRWLGHEGGALMNGISVLIKETPGKFSPTTCPVRTQKKKKSHLWTRKQALTRHQICQHSELRLLSLQKCGAFPVAKTRAPKAGGPGSITGQGTRSHVPPLRPHAAKYVFCGGASLITQLVKNLPAMQETQVQFLNWEDPLEKEMAIQSNILENPMDRGAWRATVHGVARIRHDLATKPPPPYKPLQLAVLLLAAWTKTVPTFYRVPW